jgi:hypothetical protein
MPDAISAGFPSPRRRILQVTEQEVVYQIKDTRHENTLLEARCTPAEFVAICSRNMFWTGTITPCATSACWRHGRRDRPQQPCLLCSVSTNDPSLPRQRWAASLKKHFGVDPLLDTFGQRMKWVGHKQPVPAALNIRSQRHESETFSESGLSRRTATTVLIATVLSFRRVRSGHSRPDTTLQNAMFAHHVRSLDNSFDFPRVQDRS